ncbi:glycosyltransferase [Fischerella sp. PCC 9605]|uniref:glycosyltransferase n=1 Tax=Fischerella sp. PCC 9605 TaxID=1173024 RepID=UPI00047CEA8C|nr:glycosyltransferase [Fischerella sp. PCC 9605]
MTHFGMICLGATGHINTLFPLGYELHKRGHQITVFSAPHVQSKAIAAGFKFRAIGEAEFSLKQDTQLFEQQGKLSGFAGLRHTIESFRTMVAVGFRDTPAAIKESGAEALLVDMSAVQGGTIAEHLNLPFVTVCSALTFYQDEYIPPVNTLWSYNPGWWARLRNIAAYRLLEVLIQPVWKVISEHRQIWNLPPYKNFNDLFSKLAIISQHPVEFEFPNRKLPPWFYFTGPFHDAIGRQKVDFPDEKLTGQPLIYASMGTIRNRLKHIFYIIAEACQEIDAQLVISLGGALEPDTLSNLPGKPLVVQYTPQLELLKRTTLTITHAGLNTTLESLSNAVPLVAIPISDEQPGIAARIAWTGVGEVVPLSRLSVSKLRNAIQTVLIEESYKQNAVRLQDAIHRAGGVCRAADIVEQAVSSREPVINFEF